MNVLACFEALLKVRQSSPSPAHKASYDREVNAAVTKESYPAVAGGARASYRRFTIREESWQRKNNASDYRAGKTLNCSGAWIIFVDRIVFESSSAIEDTELTQQ